MTKILDIQESIIAANGNISLAKELFTMLLADLNLRQQQIEDSFKSENIDVLAEHIHKLYGATAYCIVPNLRSVTEILEEHLRQKQHPVIAELVDNVLQEIRHLINSGPAFIEQDWDNFETES